MTDIPVSCPRPLWRGREFVGKNKLVLISAGLFLTALILGCFAVSLSSGADCFGIKPLIDNSARSRAQSSFLQNFGLSLISPMVCILLLFLLGTSAFGWLFSYPAVFARAFSIGLVSGCLYRQSLGGIGYFALILLPAYFLSSLCIMFAAADSFAVSRSFFHVVSKPQGGSPWRMRPYLMRNLIYLGVVVLSALADALMSACFIQYFVF